MSEARQILEIIIDDFSAEKFSRFFREKSRQFVARKESYTRYNDNEFKNGLKLGEINFSDNDKMIICAFEAKKELSERSGKKAQYDKAKVILKSAENQKYSAGIFIFYDPNGNFRFSLVYPESIGTTRQWNDFRRFTYFVNADPQITNKTFKQRVGDGDFSTLVKIKDAFSVEKVTKEFYKDIANWYFWAVEHCQFPKDAETEENGRNVAVIRLITRMIFIWFMRERGLVPKELFEEKNIQAILKDSDYENSTYYRAILQNLFFATLSAKKDERDFRSEIRGHKGRNPDFGNQYVYRYQDLFKKPYKIKNYFNEIPFLNGGLFECLDDKEKRIYVDGFTATKKHQPVVPNFLFFSGEKKTDLSSYYGTKSKNYKVRGLLNILSSFNFTIDENSPDDQDIALDPELLGRVFENLLASFNPETSTTARKATGSYYTPREIVDYMVAESLKAYFKTHLSISSVIARSEATKQSLDEKLDSLFSTASEENPFDAQESKKLVELIESVKIVDPAVGSGAFPMGALNKLVFILNKVDPGNELWKQAQLAVANIIPDPNIKDKTKKDIEEYFKSKKPDYWRKLYLIQRCIYGVDIQQIAVEITKLRFFISLLVDEDINDIQPLPNLDFKIMQGNSLLEEYEGIKLFDEKLLADNGMGKQKIIDSIKEKQSKLQHEYLSLHSKKQLTAIKQAELNNELKKIDKQLKDLNKQDTKISETAGLFDAQNEAKQKREALNRLHTEFFVTNDKKDKDNIRDQINKMEWELIEATLKDQNKISKLVELEKFKKSNTKPFFLWQLNFSEVFEKGGFDIVIANPPYIKEYTQKSAFDGLRNSPYYQGKMDLWYLFACKIIDFLKKDTGVLAFIAQNNWVTSYGASILRNKIINDTEILGLVDFGDYKIFECAGIQTMVMIFQKSQNKEKYVFDYRRLVGQDLKFEDVIAVLNKYENKKAEYLQPTITRNEFKDKTLTFSNSSVNPILEKIATRANFKLDTEREVAQGIVAAPDKCFVINDLSSFNDKERFYIKPFYTSTDRYAFHKTHSYIFYFSHKNFNGKDINDLPNIKKHFEKYKKILQNAKIKYGTPDKPYFYLHRERNDFYFRNGPKIAVQSRSHLPCFLYTEEEYYGSRAMNFIKTERINLKYLVSLLNSSLFSFWLWNRGKKLGDMFYIDKEPLLGLPIFKTSEQVQKPFIEVVDKILAITKSSNYLQNPDKQAKVKEYEKQIDQMVYKLYGLTPEEIKIVENNIKN